MSVVQMSFQMAQQIVLLSAGPRTFTTFPGIAVLLHKPLLDLLTDFSVEITWN